MTAISVPPHPGWNHPSAQRSSPVRILTSVLLPDPDAPVTATRLPASMESAAISRTGVGRPLQETETELRSSDSMMLEPRHIRHCAAAKADETGFRIGPRPKLKNATCLNRLGRAARMSAFLRDRRRRYCPASRRPTSRRGRATSEFRSARRRRPRLSAAAP